MSGLTNTDLINKSFDYLLAVMILVLLVLVYQVYYVLLPKVSQVAKVCGVEGIGPSHLSVLSDMGPPGTVGLYVPDGNIKSGFFGGNESPVFYPEGDENAYRQYRNRDSNASYIEYECPPGIALNPNGSCPVDMIEKIGGTNLSSQQAAQKAKYTASGGQFYTDSTGRVVQCGPKMKVNVTGDGCIEGIGPSRRTEKSEGMSGLDAAIAQMY
jgi:hypothetical protein